MSSSIKILVCGGREYDDMDRMIRELDKIVKEYDHVTIIHGCARGADSMAGEYASMRGYDVEEYPAQWDKHGRRAGPIRNLQMLNEGNPDIVVAFPGGRGTAHMTAISIEKSVFVKIILEIGKNSLDTR